jgi:hypothetical protein
LFGELGYLGLLIGIGAEEFFGGVGQCFDGDGLSAQHDTVEGDFQYPIPCIADLLTKISSHTNPDLTLTCCLGRTDNSPDGTLTR